MTKETTTTSAHTAGPWNFIENTAEDEQSQMREKHPMSVYSVEAGIPICRINQAWGQVEANARLIAAAPELLEALKVCAYAFAPEKEGDNLDYVANRDHARKVLTAAIAKAETGIKIEDLPF